MKLPQETFIHLRNAIAAEVNKYGASTILNHYEGLSDTRMMFDLCYRAAFQLGNDDSHPYFTSGSRSRSYPQVVGWRLYAGGCNDTHVATALKNIQKELKLER